MCLTLLVWNILLRSRRKVFCSHFEEDVHSGGSGGSRGWNGCKCIPLPSKVPKKCFESFLKVFKPITVFLCVSYYWERPSHLYKMNMSSCNPLTIRSLHKNTTLHLLWHFKVTRMEISSGSIRVILSRHVKGQLLILKLNTVRVQGLQETSLI